MKDYLSELEVEKIEQFCKDEVMFEAVKKVLLQGIYTHGVIEKGFKPNPLQNAAFNLASLSVSNPIPDAELGANIRGMWAGVNYLKNAVDDLKSIRRDVVSPIQDTNEAI